MIDLFEFAVINGFSKIVRVLMQVVDPSANNNAAIKMAAYHGKLKIMRVLLADPRVDPCADGNYPLRIAVIHGYDEIVDILLAAGVNPATNNNFAIRSASANGYPKIVLMLLADPRIDPTADDNFSLKQALIFQHLPIVSLLLSDTRINLSACNHLVKDSSIRKNTAAVALLLAKLRGHATIWDYVSIIKKSLSRNITMLWECHLVRRHWIISHVVSKYLIADLFEKLL